MALKLTVSALIEGLLTYGSRPDPVANTDISERNRIEFIPGTGAGGVTPELQISKLFYDVNRVLAGGAQEDLDLANAGLRDPANNFVSFAELRGIFIQAHPDNSNNIEVGGAANPVLLSNNANHKWTIGKGGIYLRTGPGALAAVAAGVSDELRVRNVSGVNEARYTIALWGI